MSGEIAVILTVRMESERMPGKVLADVAGRPLLGWITERYQRLRGPVIIATTDRSADDKIEDFGRRSSVPVFRGPVDDVVGRMDAALRRYAKNADFVFRGLGDCPFIETGFVKRAAFAMENHGGEAFVWSTAPYCMPVYGAREFPYSRSGWEKIVKGSRTRKDYQEHVDLYFHEHREEFKIIYHEPPRSAYFRPYRLEVDYPEDLELVRRIAEEVGMLAPLEDILRWLDSNSQAAMINRTRVEKTGPSTLSYRLKRAWHKLMVGNPILRWDDSWWEPPGQNAHPIYCSNGSCIVGWGYHGQLHTNEAIIEGRAFIKCGCGAGLVWQERNRSVWS